MNTHLKRLTLAMAGAAIITLVGCGGSPGGGTAAVTPEVTTADVATRVIDGAISNALVCMDKNRNGECDASEPQGRTDASGNLTLKVDKADVGKFPLLTLVGIDAVDADHGPVTEPFAMTTPPGKSSVISPLTTMVAQAMESGATEAEAEATVKGQTGITVSLFEDFVKVGKPATGKNPGDVARMIVITTQEQSKVLSASVGTQLSDGTVLSKQDLQKAVFRKLLQILPTVVAEMDNASGAGDQKAKEAAVRAKIVASLMTKEEVKTAVEANREIAKEIAAGPQPYVPVAGINLDSLNYLDNANWSIRILGNSLAQATLDSQNKLQVFDRRLRNNAGQIAQWFFGSNPADNANFHWNGSAWTQCGLNHTFPVTVRDVNGNNSSNYCDNYSTNASNRALVDVAGKTMLSVYNGIIDSKYTNYTIANAATALGTATFPADSKLAYVESTRLTNSFAYNPGSNSLVFKFPQSTGDATACNAPNPATAVTTLEELVAAFPGLPCVSPTAETISNINGVFSGDAPREAWGSTTLGITTVGTAPVLATPTSFYTTNTYIRLAFTAGAAKEVTYYSCKQRQITGSTRECKALPIKGSYSITDLPDGSRFMSISNPPSNTAHLTFDKAFLQRNGAVHHAYQDKMTVSRSVRLNTVGTQALLSQLAVPPVNPELTMPLTAASYQGTWDFRGTTEAFAFNIGTRLVINGTNGNNTIQCFDNTNGASFGCTFSVTNPATGAFTLTNTGNGNVATGTFDFMTGTASGINTPLVGTPGAFVGQRR